MDLDLEHSGLDENRRPQLQTGSGEVALKRGRDNQLAESNEGDCPSKRRRCSFDELYNGALQEQGRRNENRGKENGNASLPAHVSTSSTVRRSSSRDESQQQQQQRRDVNVALFTSRTRSNSKSEMSQGVRVKSAARTIPEEEENDAGVDSDALSRSERPSSSQTHVESICNDAEEELCISRSSEQPGPRMGDVSVPPTPITSRSSSEPFTSTVSSTSSSTSSSVHAEDKKEDKLVRNNFECKVEEDTPYVLLGSRENSKAQYKEGEFEIDMIADHDERTGDYLVAWKGWTMSTMSYVSLADLNSPELLKIYKEYVRAASAIERRPVVERVGHHERILWRNIGFYSGRHALFKNKLREARFNLLLQEMNIAPVFVENWLATLRKKSNFGELPPFRLTYKSFMSGHLRRKFLALPHDFNECRCRCENGAEDCSTSNLDCCTNGVSTDSDNVRLFYDLSKRLALPNRIQAVTYELVECSDSCKCGPACPNRVTQRGRQVPVVIFFEDADKNWGLRAGEPIRRGQYIAEYVGEVKLASSFEKDADETYQFQIPSCFEFDGKKDSLIIDASEFGSEARFINHSCTPNALPVWVYSDDYGSHYARSCFFAIRDIQAGEEITFNYYSGADLKKKMKNGVKCRCSPKCKNYIPDRTQQQSDAQAMSSPEKAERSMRGEKNKRKSMANPSQDSSSNNGDKTFGGSPFNRLLTTQQDRIQQSARLQQFERQARADRRSSFT